MIRACASILLCLCLLALQISFINALPAPFAYAPLLVCTSAFLYQSVGMRHAAWFVALEGVFLDALGLGVAPLETVAYAVGAASLVMSSARVFTNRSYYGLAACAVIIVAAITAMQAANIFVALLLGDAHAGLPFVLTKGLWGSLLVLPLLLVMFPWAKHIRAVMELLRPL